MTSRAGRTGRGGRGGRSGRGRGDHHRLQGALKKSRKSVVEQLAEANKRTITATGKKTTGSETVTTQKDKHGEARTEKSKYQKLVQEVGTKELEEDEIEEYGDDESAKEKHGDRNANSDSDTDKYDSAVEKIDEEEDDDEYDLSRALPRHLRGKRKTPPSPTDSNKSDEQMQDLTRDSDTQTPDYSDDSEASNEDPSTPTKSNRVEANKRKESEKVKPKAPKPVNPYFRRKKTPPMYTKTMEEINGRKHLERFDLRVFVPESDNPVGTLKDTLTGILLQLQQADPAVAFCPYRMEDKELPLVTKLSNFPTDVSGMMSYFPGVTPSPKGRTNYCKILVAHTKSWESIKMNVSWWLQTEGHGIWQRVIQHENVDCMGWLMYSHRNIDLKYLKEEIHSQTDIEVGLRYRVVRTGEYSKMKVSADQLVRAVHIEVARHDLAKAEKHIRDAYAADSQDFPGGIRMRLIPEYSNYLNPKSKAKIKHLAAKQLAWINNVRTARTWEIMSLDLPSRENGKSIRQMIMEIPTPGKTTKMFHSMGEAYQGMGIILNFTPQQESEGRMMVAGLLPYLKWKHGEWVEKFFSDAAVVRAQSAEWDEENQMVISETDRALDDLANIDDDLDLTTEAERTSVVFENAPTGGRKNVPVPEDDDSVSTFRTAAKRRTQSSQSTDKSQQHSFSPGFNGEQFNTDTSQKTPRRNRDDATHASSLSWNSKVTTMEAEINTVRSDVSQMQTSVASVEERMTGMSNQMAQMMLLLGKIAEKNTGQQGEHPGDKDGGSAGGGNGPAGGR